MIAAVDDAIREFLSEGRAVLGRIKDLPEGPTLCWIREYDEVWCLGLALLYRGPNHTELLSTEDLSTVTTFKTEEAALRHFLEYQDDQQVQDTAHLAYRTLLSRTANPPDIVI